MSKKLILDEYHSFVATPTIINELKKIDCVPDVQYKVDGEQVFVLDKLVSLLKTLELPSDPIERRNVVSQAVLAAMPDAYLSAIEAVTSWEIKPESYEIRLVDGAYIVWHKAFNSFIPVTFSSLESARLALADLLTGKNIPTQYDTMNKSGGVKTFMQPARSEHRGSPSVVTSYLYSFAGQVLQQDKNENTEFNFSFSEIRGFFPFNSRPEDVPESSLHSGDSFQDGFPLISREHYQNLLKQSAAWFFDSEKAENEVNNYFSDENSWFGLLSAFDLSDSHISKGWQLNDEDQQTINTIRHFFPELSSFDDAVLYDNYQCFMADVRCMRSFDRSDIYRDEEFLFYILGVHSMAGVPEELQISDKVNIGFIAAYFYSIGLTVREAIGKAKNYARITRNIHRVMWDCKKAFSYISLHNNSGGKITTGPRRFSIEDSFKVLRKHNVGSITATQSLSSFALSNDKLSETKTTKH
ncbi:TPA: hypothetical protein MDZ54_004763 [Klebsiella pneumoniae]|nr:hypothetical protein [Klebsiella pneumoniae]